MPTCQGSVCIYLQPLRLAQLPIAIADQAATMSPAVELMLLCPVVCDAVNTAGDRACMWECLRVPACQGVFPYGVGGNCFGLSATGPGVPTASDGRSWLRVAEPMGGMAILSPHLFGRSMLPKARLVTAV